MSQDQTGKRSLLESLEKDPEFIELARELQIDGSWTAMQLLAKDSGSGSDGGSGGSGSGGSSGSSCGDSCGSGSSP
jgi:hypothetical protein